MKSLILVCIALISIIILALAKKGIIEFPQSEGGLIFMSFSVFMIIFALGVGTYYAGESAILCFGPIIIFSIVGFAAGYTYYSRSQKKGSDVQTLDLND